ncbi:hypothetical protein GDO86_008525, partial [Hymenochirus boettgeri]
FYIFFTVWIVVGILMIAVGVIYKDDCPIQPYIPIFLIVTGAIHIVTFITMLMRYLCETFSALIEGLIGIFSFAWFITGSVWVFSVYSRYEGLCDKNLYLFAFGILQFEYVVIALGLLSFCCLCSLRNLFYERLE